VQYEDGAMADGGKPLWSLTSFGDTGNGFLSAVAILQALYHRARTGEGQFVGTSIVNAQLLNCSYALGRPDGSGFDRPRLDRMQLGKSALYGIYETSAGWLAIVAFTEGEWQALRKALGHAALNDPKFATAEGRKTHDLALRAELEQVFHTRPAAEWLVALDAAGAPAEIVDPEFGRHLFDDPEMQKRRWVTAYDQGLVGKFEHAGLVFDFSDTPAVIQGPPLVVGDHTAEIMRELGYSDERIAELCGTGAIATWSPGEPPIRGFKAVFKTEAQEPAKA
jgi:crotonobetainyl-CoA:carnitine CoA-transferase CaiB-like acyl-CoA transferase